MDLEQKTQAYWNVRKAYSGVKGSKKMSVQKALDELGDVLDDGLSPDRPLTARIHEVREAIIDGGPKNAKAKCK